MTEVNYWVSKIRPITIDDVFILLVLAMSDYHSESVSLVNSVLSVLGCAVDISESRLPSIRLFSALLEYQECQCVRPMGTRMRESFLASSYIGIVIAFDLVLC